MHWRVFSSRSGFYPPDDSKSSVNVPRHCQCLPRAMLPMTENGCSQDKWRGSVFPLGPGIWPWVAAMSMLTTTCPDTALYPEKCRTLAFWWTNIIFSYVSGFSLELMTHHQPHPRGLPNFTPGTPSTGQLPDMSQVRSPRPLKKSPNQKHQCFKLKSSWSCMAQVPGSWYTHFSLSPPQRVLKILQTDCLIELYNFFFLA